MAVALQASPSEPVYLTSGAVVNKQILGFLGARVPGGGDHQIHRHINRYYVGRAVETAAHASQYAFPDRFYSREQYY